MTMVFCLIMTSFVNQERLPFKPRAVNNRQVTITTLLFFISSVSTSTTIPVCLMTVVFLCRLTTLTAVPTLTNAVVVSSPTMIMPAFITIPLWLPL